MATYCCRRFHHTQVCFNIYKHRLTYGSSEDYIQLFQNNEDFMVMR